MLTILLKFICVILSEIHVGCHQNSDFLINNERMSEWRLKAFDQSDKSLTIKSDSSKNNVKIFADVVEEYSYSVIFINDSDLQSRENWRGTSEPAYASLKDYDSDKDYKDEPQTNMKEKVDAQNENGIHLKTKNDVEHKPSHSKFFPAYPKINLNNKAVSTKNVKCYTYIEECF